MSEEKNDQLFQENTLAIATRDAAAVARATQEIQASLVIGKRFPRDEISAKAKILEACKRKGLAEVAEYEYSRGGTRITGPTIDLMRAIASRWGNILFGWAEVERRDGMSSVRCWAWDVQGNARAERTFSVRHWRDTQAGGYELKDERDIYELMANQAARRVRACLEEVIDSDVIAEAVDACRVTLRSAGGKESLKDRAVKMVVAFGGEFGVTQAQIEARLGNKLEAISENQLASLRRIYKSLKDGVGQREDYFKPEAAAPKFPAETSETSAATASAATASTETSEPEEEARFQAKAKSEELVRIVRVSCKAAKIGEGNLLAFLADTGFTDGSAGSLDDLTSDILQNVVDKWGDIREKMTPSAKGKGKEKADLL